ncbi:CrcB-like protein, Camphor Resistance (CrcB), partial [Teratosphaeria destructans]
MSPPAGADQPRPSPSPARGGLGSADEHRDLAQRGAPSHGPIRPSDGEDEPRESQNLGEIAAGQPTSTEEEDASRLERALSNESWRRHRRGPHPRRDRTQPHEGLAENAAGRPISSSEAEPEPDSMQGPHGRETCQDGNDDIEKGSWRAPAPAVCQSPRRTLEPPKTEPMIPESTRAPPRWLTELYTISYLIFFSIMGTLARLGMQWLTFYPGAPIVTPVVWANFAGSVVMGFLAEDQALFRDHFPPPADAETPLSAPTDAAVDLEKERKAASAKTKKTIPLYIGLATGFCGSFTSFSSFARDAFLALSNDLPTPLDHPAALPSTTATLPRHGGYSFEAWAAVVLITLALSLGGLLAGAHLALFLHPYTPRLPHRLLDPLTLLLATGTWLGALALCIRPPDRSAPPETWRGDALFALVLAPPACLLRFYTSQHLNPLLPTFPLGTFTVN